VAAPHPEANVTDRRPDLVLVMTDQQRHDQVGYVGATPVRTPVLDRLAADGVVFTDAYSGSTTCVPSRTSLMTGLFDHRVPQVGRGEMEQGTFTVPHALRAAGYQTALVGKMHFTPIRADHGFEVMRVCEHLNAFAEPPEAMAELDHYHDWLRSEGLADWRFEVAGLDPRRYPYATATHPTSWVRDQALDVLSARDPERPLFLVVSFPHPHPPVNPPDEYAAAYDPAGCEVDPGSDAVNARLPAPFREALAQADAPHRRVHAASLDRHREDLARTYALITQIDEAVGVVLDRIDLDRTVLFFTSDHGDYAGHRGLLRKVPWIPFDDLARVPFFATGGPVVGGRTEAAPVQSFDLAATFLDLAGADVDLGALDGDSLAGVLAGGEAPADRVVLSALTTGWPMARRGSQKYVRGSWGSEVLFDVERDPGETFDLKAIPGGAEAVAALSAEVDRALALAIPDLPRFAPTPDRR